jgi:hypothetical protein
MSSVSRCCGLIPGPRRFKARIRLLPLPSSVQRSSPAGRASRCDRRCALRLLCCGETNVRSRGQRSFTIDVGSSAWEMMLGNGCVFRRRSRAATVGSVPVLFHHVPSRPNDGSRDFDKVFSSKPFDCCPRGTLPVRLNTAKNRPN